MTSQVQRRIAVLSEEISLIRSELSMLRDRLASARSGFEDARLRMLLAETPIADTQLQAAARQHRRVEHAVAEVEAELARTKRERDRLAALAPLDPGA